MVKKVSIIGAGLAGLSAGIILQKQGVQTEIFELADWAGGMCTSWVRKGYRFDGCVHWMVGTKPGNPYHDAFLEVGALEKDTVIYNAEFVKYEIGGTMYTVPMKYEEFRSFLHSLSPEDAEKIDELCEAVKTLMESKMPVAPPKNPVEMMRFMKESAGFLKVARSYTGMTVTEFAENLKNSSLRSLIKILMPGDFSMSALIMMLGTRMSGNAGYPMGGSLGIIRRMEAKYRELGGNIRFRSKVDEITAENSKVTGIKSKGVFYPSDYVIAACDAYDTLKRMLGGKYSHPQLDGMLESSPLFEPMAIVSFGLKKRFDIPYSQVFECPDGICTSPDTVQNFFNLRSFDFDPAAAPEGGSSVMSMLEAPLDYWKNLRENDKIEYANQKKLLADAVAQAADRRIPGFRDAIDAVDVATPATYVRLANLYQGSWEGFAPTPKALTTRISKTMPGLKNFAVCGQWTSAGGGICSAVMSGKEAAELAGKAL